MTSLWVLIAQIMASTTMAAIAWFVQIVHYPLFHRLSRAGTLATGEDATSRRTALSDWHAENVRRTRPVVLVPMAVEAATAAWLAVFPPPAIGRVVTLVGLSLAVAAIVTTALIQVPLHERLRAGEDDPDIVRSLVRSTRLRTAIWTGRAGLAAWMLHAAA
jgi:hypothetical protein